VKKEAVGYKKTAQKMKRKKEKEKELPKKIDKK